MKGFNFNLEEIQALKDRHKSKAKYPVISQCPVCHNDLVVEALNCDKCNTRIEGKFVLSKFNYLDTEKLYFIEVFVKNRGNIKAIEKEMDYSYPTIKKMLDEVIIGLGYKPDGSPEPEDITEEQPDKSESRIEILERLNKGEIDFDTANDLLKKLK
jgi:hypothetical protein